jgi:hypothetical protein
MNFNITYELSVECSISSFTENPIRFPIKFFIAKIEDLTLLYYTSRKSYDYEVWFLSEDVIIMCKTFCSEIEAIRYISMAMKYAMKGQLVYQVCKFCYKNVFYPLKHCINCTLLVNNKTAKWYLQKFQIEKTPKHLGLFIKHVYRPSKRYPSISISS